MSTERISRAAGAAEQLSAALWETLREQIDAGEVGRAGELSRRLIEVCESFGAVAELAARADQRGAGTAEAEGGNATRQRRLDSGADSGADSRTDPRRRPSRSEERGAEAIGGRFADLGGEAPARGEEGPVRDRSVRGDSVREASIREDSAREDSAREDSAREDSASGDSAREASIRETRPGELGEPALAEQDSSAPQRLRPFSGVAASLIDEYDEEPGTIEVKDVRAGGHPPIAAAVRRRLDRHAADGAPFALLLVEVLDVERLRALGAGGELLREIWGIESAIAEQLRPADSLLREIDGRWWLLAPDTDVAGARELAGRLAAAAQRFDHRGAPMRVVIGIAACPDHGVEPSTLIGHADVDLYAAQAAGRSIGGSGEEPHPA